MIEEQMRDIRASSVPATEQVDYLNALGWDLRTGEDWANILELAARARELATSHGYQRGIAGSLRNSAFAHFMLSDYATAAAEGLESLRLFQEGADPQGESHARAIIAYVQWSLGNYDRAMGEALRALDLAERGADKWGVAWCSTLIGGIHDSLRNYESALRCHQKSHQLFEELGVEIGEARSLIGIASAYQAMGDSGRALECLHRSLDLFRRIGNRTGESRALHDIAAVYQDQGKDDDAVKLHLESLQIREDEQRRTAAATSLLSLGRLYLKNADLAKALSSVQRALAIAEECKANPKVSQAHQLLSQIYEQQDDLVAALRHERAFHRVREQVFKEEASIRLKNLQTSLETERSQREAEMHRQRNAELKAKNEELARLLEELQATQMQLVHNEKMASLGGLVAAITHEINTPLGTIQSSCDLTNRLVERIVQMMNAASAAEELKADPAFANALRALATGQRPIAMGVLRIADIVRNLKSFAQLDGAEYAEFDVNAAVENVLALVQPRLQNGVSVVRDFGELPRLRCYVAELNQVFMNLLENAVQAVDGAGTITISTLADDHEIRVRFADTGRGIPHESLPRLFDPSIRTKGGRARAAVSLFTCLHVVRKHNGTIDVESETGKGSTFTVRLPRTHEHKASAGSAA